MEKNEGQKRMKRKMKDEERECDDLQASPGQTEEISSTSASDYVLPEGPESEDGSAGLASRNASLATASFQERDECEGVSSNDLTNEGILVEGTATASEHQQSLPGSSKSSSGHCEKLRFMGITKLDPNRYRRVHLRKFKKKDEVHGYTTYSQLRVSKTKEKHRRGVEAAAQSAGALLVPVSTPAADVLPSHATSDQDASVLTHSPSPSFPVKPEPQLYPKQTPSKSLRSNTEPPVLLITIPTSHLGEQWRQSASASGLEFGFEVNERGFQASIFPPSISSRSSSDYSVPSNERESKGSLEPKDEPSISTHPEPKQNIRMFKSEQMPGHRSDLADKDIDTILKFIEYDEKPSKGLKKKQKPTHRKKHTKELPMASSVVVENQPKIEGITDKTPLVEEHRRNREKDEVYGYTTDGQLREVTMKEKHRRGVEAALLVPVSTPAAEVQPCESASTQDASVLAEPPEPFIQDAVYGYSTDSQSQAVVKKKKRHRGVEAAAQSAGAVVVPVSTPAAEVLPSQSASTQDASVLSHRASPAIPVKPEQKLDPKQGGTKPKTPSKSLRPNTEPPEPFIQNAVYGYTTDSQSQAVVMKKKRHRGVEAAAQSAGAVVVPVSTPAAEVLPSQSASTQDASVLSHTASPAIPVKPEQKLDPKQGGTKPKTPSKSLRPNTEPPEPLIQNAVYGYTTDSQSQAVVMKKKRRRGVEAAAQSAGAMVVPVSTPAADVLPSQSASTQDASVLSHTASPAIPVKPEQKLDPKQGGTKPKTPSKSLRPNAEPPEPFIQNTVYGYTTDSQSQAVVMKKKRRRGVKAAAQSAGAMVVPVSTAAAEVLPSQSASTQDASVLIHTASPAIPVKPEQKLDPKQGGTKPKTPSKSLRPNTEPPEHFIQNAVYGYTTDSQSQAVVMKKKRRRGVKAAAQSAGAMVVPVSTAAAEVLPSQSASTQDASVLSHTASPAIPVKAEPKLDPKQGGTKPKTLLKSLRPNTEPPVLFTSQRSHSDEQRRQSASARRLEFNVNQRLLQPSGHLDRKVYWGKTESTNERLRSVQPEPGWIPIKLPPQRFADKVTEPCTKNYSEVVKASMTAPISKPSSRRISIVTPSSTGGDRNASEPRTVELALAESLPSQAEAVPMTARKTEERSSQTSHVVCGHCSGATMPKLAVPGVTPVYTPCCRKQCPFVLVVTRIMCEKGTMTEDCMGIPPQPSAPVEAQQDLPQQEPERSEEEYTDEECEEEADAHPPAISESHRALIEYFSRTFDEALNDPETVIYGEEE